VRSDWTGVHRVDRVLVEREGTRVGAFTLRLGLCDAVVAGGIDSLSPLTACGFFALEAIAPERSNPFSRNRRG
jgi:3-oxoacyl-(acyl-carrier-protein) synthase